MECIVVAFCKNFGIGKNNKIPWHIPEDLYNFKCLTNGNTVVMGRNTYESIGSPLSNRFNIVYTSTPEKYKHIETSSNNIKFVSDISKSVGLLRSLSINSLNSTIYYIGGDAIYKYASKSARYIYATVIDKEYDCDTFFPHECLQNYDLVDTTKKFYSEKEECFYYFAIYELKHNNSIHGEPQYLDLMRKILKEGEERIDRTNVGTYSLFGGQLDFDVSTTVPFLTTKQLAWKTVLKELIWFLKGDTNSKNLESQGVNIWKGNTSREFLDNRGLTDYVEGDMGPLYSHSMRHYGAEYSGCNTDYTGKGYDQLTELVKGLIEDPMSRRHVITMFNPAVVDKCVLMPCHGIAIQFYCSGTSELSCHVYCRSSDTFLGLPFNIASYTMLLYIIAKKVNRSPKRLVISLGDVHIYKNHIEQVKKQLSRCILPQPKLIIKDTVINKRFDEIEINDFDLKGYICHGSIRAPMAV